MNMNAIVRIGDAVWNPGVLKTITQPIPDAWPQPNRLKSDEMLVLVNIHRQGIGLQPMGKINTLNASGEWKASNQAMYTYLDHDDHAPPITRSWLDRILSFGYAGNEYCAENMAETLNPNEPPEQVLGTWLTSAAHKQNIENPAWTVTGVGVATNTNNLTYWVQDFGVGVPDVPVPTPNVDRLAGWVKSSLPMLLASSYFKKYKKDHPTEAAAILNFINNTTIDPQVETLFGHFLGSTIENLAN